MIARSRSAGVRAPRIDGGKPGAIDAKNAGAASRAFAKTGLMLRVRKSGSAKLIFTAAGQARVLIVIEPGATLAYTEIAASSGFETHRSETHRTAHDAIKRLMANRVRVPARVPRPTKAGPVNPPGSR